MSQKNNWIWSIIAIAVVVGIFFAEFRFGQSAVTRNEVSQKDAFRQYTFYASSTAQIDLSLNTGTTTNATSTSIDSYFDTNNFKDNGYFVIKGAKRVTMFFSRGDSNDVGTSTFSVQVSPDGNTWLNYNKLISNVTNTISQNLTRVRFVTMTGSKDLGLGNTATTTYSLDPNDSWFGVRCLTTIDTDGINYCTAVADW